MMKSLAFKLTLCFLVAGLTGAILVAVLVHRTTRTAFDQYVIEQGRQMMASELENYYQNTGSWEGVGDYLRFHRPEPGQPQEFPREWRTITLVGLDGRIVLCSQRSRIGQMYTDSDLSKEIALTANDQTVGWLVLPSVDQRTPAGPEADFLRRLNWATFLSAIAATGLALALGGFLALTLTRSLRELTDATEGIAQGKLGLQVKIRSKDELGILAKSFNKMSSDLARATQARRQMTADIAHDLRTPLSVISGYAEALNDGKLAGTPEVYEILDGEARHLARLVEDLRLLSLADAGELRLVLQTIQPETLLERAQARYAHAANDQGISLAVDIEPGLPEVTVDVERMAQVLDNLVTNAFRFTPEGGSITLRGRRVEDGLVLEVMDTGKGIAAEDIPYVFDRFYRGDKSRQGNGESGLGLAIARSIIESHGGRIWVESQEGQGARFKVWIGTQ